MFSYHPFKETGLCYHLVFLVTLLNPTVLPKPKRGVS